MSTWKFYEINITPLQNHIAVKFDETCQIGITYACWCAIMKSFLNILDLLK